MEEKRVAYKIYEEFNVVEEEAKTVTDLFNFLSVT